MPGAGKPVYPGRGHRPRLGIANRLSRWGVSLGALLLIAAASLKIVSLCRLRGPAAVQLHWPSVVFPFVSEIALIRLVIILECLVAGAVLLSRDDLLRAALIAWLSTVFLGYHFCLCALGQGIPCHCLGTWSGGSQRIFDLIGMILLAALLGIGWSGLAIQGCSRLYGGLKAFKERRRSSYGD